MNGSGPAPIITLTTDFGTADHYVGTMKGVILARCRNAQIVDVSHGVAAFSIWEGAYTISQAAPYFPAGTIHVVVVDPGVGTERKPILLEALGQIFIAPDNGVLSFILEADVGATVRELNNEALFLPSCSATFHGRDIFAAVAGRVAGGAKADQVGSIWGDPLKLEGLMPTESANGRWDGRVLSVDHFGNVVTNISARSFSPRLIEAGGVSVGVWRQTFGEAQDGEVFLYRGSSGYVEIGMNQARAVDVLGLRPGDPIAFNH